MKVLVLTALAGVSILLILIGSAVDFRSADAGQTTATVSGIVYEDTNGDGLRQLGEDGLDGRTVTLSLSQGGERTAMTQQGLYTIPDVPDGSHTLATELDATGIILCSDSFGGFDPLRLDDCFSTGQIYYTATTPETVSVTVVAGQDTQVNFAGERRDIATLNAIAMLNGEYAPVGTTVRASHGSATCGESQVSEPGGNGNITLVLEVSGASERTGCPNQGEPLSISIGGVPTTRDIVWNGPATSTDHLVAMPDHAWFWTETRLDSSPVEGAVVLARIDGVTCGQAKVTRTLHGGVPVYGFGRLIVPSDAIQPGCGRTGATVTFHFGASVIASAKWVPDFQRVNIPLDKPILVIDGPADFPKLGGSPYDTAATTEVAGLSADRSLALALILGASPLIWYAVMSRKRPE